MIRHEQRKRRIGIIGDYNASLKSHLSTQESLGHAADSLGYPCDLAWFPTEQLAQDTKALNGCHGIWAAPGAFINRVGILNAIRYARENNVPFLGTCGGFQNTLLEYARNVLCLTDADHEETSPDSSSLFITKLSCSLAGSVQSVRLISGTLSHRAYGKNEAREHFNCNYGLNPAFRHQVEESALTIAGVGPHDEPRIIELPSHCFFVATLFLPQVSSTHGQPHPIIMSFVQKAAAHEEKLTTLI